MQKTIKKSVTFTGAGVHLGRPVRVNIKPAPINHGLVFKRLDVVDHKSRIAANFQNIHKGELCTSLTNKFGVSVKTVEHLLAALSGLGIHNALIETDNEEIPILDGSSLMFVQSLNKAGISNQNQALQFCSIKKTIIVENKNGWVKLEPLDVLKLTVSIDYPDTCIGKQNLSLLITDKSFENELCDNRTFCLKKDIKNMRSRGLALGGSLDNAIVVDGYNVINPSGLRRKDEFVRHKMLDALGDLTLSGLPVIGHYSSFCGEHNLNNQLLIKLFSNKNNYEMLKSKTTNFDKIKDHDLRFDSLNYGAVI